jgi:transcriptional regulator with GAF, ATPase, and Fis domain
MLLTRKNKSNFIRTLDSLNSSGDPFLLEKGSAAKRFIRRFGNPGSDLMEFAQKVLSQIAREKEIIQGVFLMLVNEENVQKLRFLSGYACMKLENEEHEFLLGEGLPGQVAKEGKILILKDVPQGYITIRTGLGQASPNSLIIFPVKSENKILGVIELASFHEFTSADEEFFTSLSELIAGQMILFLNENGN